MSLLVFGQSGQVARALARLAPEAVFLPRSAADLSDPDACAAAIHAKRPGAVINAAAWTAVDTAEADEAAAAVINAAAPAAMARACAELAIPFLTISTDYVFDGSGDTPWTPDAPTAPINAYGRSKRAGERAVQAAGGQAAILRTSWVFSSEGANFLKTMLRLSETRDALDVVDDQIGGPTPAESIARAALTITDAMARGRPGGIWHIAGRPYVSWAGFAEWIFACAGRKVTVNPIPTAAWPTPAPRPLNSRLDCTTLARDFALGQPDWKAQARADIRRLLA
ncbi:MAG: dTDP-4-dehydrorhamnose reductase RmlD [Rhodobacteraceae bacterium HLUCCA12]|nr:MAG: dTDP-4-dehydrorhamnose reductase RmlD [Rhodobacteraceae bacterium HLUCCA12]